MKRVVELGANRLWVRVGRRYRSSPIWRVVLASVFSAAVSPGLVYAADTTPPSTPTGLTATAASPTQINLSWTASTDAVGVTGYQVDRCTGASCTNYAQIATPASNSYNDTGRTPSTTYRYRVRARDAVPNWSAFSSVVTRATPADTTAPSVPTGLTATPVSATQINLSWTASTDNVAVTGYQVDRCTGASCTNYAQIATPATTTFNDTGRTASTTYRYRVRARDAVPNWSAFTATVNATTLAPPDTTPPTVPTGLTATAVSATQINLTWTASTDAVGVTGYQVDRCTGASCTNYAQIATPTTNSFNDTGRAPATTYRYRVRARDAVPNWSAFSTVVNRATPADTTAPSVPTGLTATPASATQINLSWTASTDDVQVTGYQVDRCTGSSCTNYAQIATPVTNSFNDTGRTANTTYRYRVRTRDAGPNWSAFTSTVNATTSSGVVDCD